METKSSFKTKRFEGYLRKWTNYVKQYQRRWFIYENGYLTYYRDRSEVGEVARSQVHLLGCLLRKTGNLAFTISKKNEVLFVLRAETKEDFDKWQIVIGSGIIECNQEFQGDVQSQKSLQFFPLSDSLNHFNNVHDSFLTLSSVVFENGQQMSFMAHEIEKLLLISLSEIENLRHRETVLEISERISIFNELNIKFQKSMNEFVKTGELLAENAAVYRASQNRFNHLSQERMSNSSHSDAENSNHQSETSSRNCKESLISDDDQFFDATVGSSMEDKQDNSSSRQRLSRGSISHMQHITSKTLHHARSVSDIIKITPPSVKKYRSVIPPRPNVRLSLWNLISNMIGKDLSKVPLPVNFNEPISMLQRVTESLEYSDLLDKASACDCPLLQMCYVAAYTVSNYCSTSVRTHKPFNPLLGETFEYDRTSDLGWRCICEQVSHHPPVCALYAEGNGWILCETYDVKSKFMAKYLEIQPHGLSQITFTRTGFRYTWNKVFTTVNNIVIGTLWIDQFGKMTITNHSTGDQCHIEFFPYSVFRSADHKKVQGIVQNRDKELRYTINGYWDKFIECSKLMKKGGDSQTSIDRKMIWTANRLPHAAEKMYYFSAFTCSLNEMDPTVAPTDSRRRPDQRAMENGDFESANNIKAKLEEGQRMRRKIILQKHIATGKADSKTTIEDIHEPLWFKIDKTVKHDACKIYMYKGGYWEAKQKNDFSVCEDIFNV